MKTKKELLYEGKVKKIYTSNNKNNFIMFFTNNLTCFNGDFKKEFLNKGKICCEISAILFKYIQKNNIDTHFINVISKNEMEILKTKPIPLEFIVRNYAAGNICKRLNIKKDKYFKKPVINYTLKIDSMNDPIIFPSEIISLMYLTKSQLDTINIKILKINNLLSNLLINNGMKLIDFKVEFGILNNKIYLIDELSPENMRIYDRSNKSLDKDVFRFGSKESNDVLLAYKKVLDKLKKI